MRGIAVIVSLLIAGCSNPGHTKKDALINRRRGDVREHLGSLSDHFEPVHDPSIATFAPRLRRKLTLSEERPHAPS